MFVVLCLLFALDTAFMPQVNEKAALDAELTGELLFKLRLEEEGESVDAST
jgi:hypothetical protein